MQTVTINFNHSLLQQKQALDSAVYLALLMTFVIPYQPGTPTLSIS